jgi:PRC-barrel domain
MITAHREVSYRQLAAVVLALACVLSGCHTAPPKNRPVVPTEPSTPPAEMPPATTDNDIPPPNSEGAKAQPADTPACSCIDNTPKPAPKRKPKPVVHAPPPAPPEVASGPPAPGEANVKIVEGGSASILGKKVRGQDGDDLGRVVDILADQQGRVRIAIIEFGGFLGVGNRRIAVDWSLLKFQPGDPDAPAILNASKRKLQGTPEYKGTERPLALMAPVAPAVPAAPASPPPTAPK